MEYGGLRALLISGSLIIDSLLIGDFRLVIELASQPIDQQSTTIDRQPFNNQRSQITNAMQATSGRDHWMDDGAALCNRSSPGLMITTHRGSETQRLTLQKLLGASVPLCVVFSQGHSPLK